MVIEQQVFAHPTQGSQVRLAVFEQQAGGSPVEGLPDPAGFLVTEEWLGAGKVVKTLGAFDGKGAALDCLRRRATSLAAQRFSAITPA